MNDLERHSLEVTRARMAEIELESEAHVPTQHLISKTLLRRFAQPVDGIRKLISFNLAAGRGKPRPPSRCGTVEDFVKIGSASAERMWAEVENRLPAAIRAADNGSIWKQHCELQVVLLDAIALHFSRSIQVTILSERIWTSTRETEEQRLFSNPDLLAQMFEYRYHGLVPAGPGAFRAIVDDLHRETVQVIGSGAWKRVRVEEMYLAAREFTRAGSLQIGRAHRGELLVGDIPALSIRQGHPGVGLLGGVALKDSTTIALPLGPQLIAGLASEPGEVALEAGHVDRLNNLQIQAAQERVYMRPGSGLEAYVLQRRKPTVRSRDGRS